MSDEPALTVVTVTYSSGTHLERFLSSLTVATDLPVRVIIADNGSIDGAPEEAVQRYPQARLLRTGSNRFGSDHRVNSRHTLPSKIKDQIRKTEKPGSSHSPAFV